MGRRHLSFLAYKSLGDLMQAMPEPVAAVAAQVVATGLLAGRRKERAVHARHMRRVLGADLSDADVAIWTRRAFSAYARYWHEGACLTAVPPATVAQRMLVERGMEYLHAGMAAGKGVVMALPHVGSWEWGGAWLSMIGYPMISVAEPLKPPELYDYFVAQREAIGLTILPLAADTSGALAAGARRRAPRRPALRPRPDRQRDRGGVLRREDDDAGGPRHPGAAHRGDADHDRRLQRPGSGPHRGDQPAHPDRAHGPAARDVARLTQRIATEFEGFIRRAPEQWHLFQPNWPSDRAEAGEPAVGPTPGGGAA